MFSSLRMLTLIAGVTAGCLIAYEGALAQDRENLAKQLSNPIASLISVPFQFNYDGGYGPTDGEKAFVNVQPVIPISLSQDWKVISRTILPVVWQNDVAGSSGEQFGLGDVVHSLFFSPVRPTQGGVIWGIGPAFLLPTATDDLLGGEQWGAGPTGVALKQSGPWTYGLLANHIWSLAGESDRDDVNATFLQPFVAYTTRDAWTYGLNSESTYNWDSEEWSAPFNLTISKLIVVDRQPISLVAGLRYWAESPDNGPEGVGFRVGVTVLFPK